MKKNTLLLLALLMGTCLSVQAQVKFGLRAGLNMTKTNLDTSVKSLFKSETSPGFFVGPSLEFTLPIVGLGFDVSALYDNRKLTIENSLGTSESTTIHNVSVPLNLHWNINILPGYGLYAATGPQVSWNIGNKLGGIFSTDYKLRNSTLSWNIGGGFNLGPQFQLGYTYNVGIGSTGELTNIKEGYDTFSKNSKLKSNTHQIHITYFF